MELIKLCPYMRKANLHSLARSIPPKNHADLIRDAQKCPIMKREISTSSVCPFASTVDTFATVGPRGAMQHQPHHSIKEAVKATLNFKLDMSPKTHRSVSPHAATQHPNSETHTKDGMFDYEGFCDAELDKKHKDKRYSRYDPVIATSTTLTGSLNCFQLHIQAPASM
jgi:hypothetical protein